MRLIDADEFIKKFNYSDGDSEDEKIWIATMRKLIKDEPTAYDVDKVVEELESLKNRFDLNDFAIRGIIEKSIEIIKRGGKE